MPLKLDPYLFFVDTCREAMEFYQSVFGGTLDIKTYDEMPPSDMPGMEKMSGKVAHAHLTGGDITLMASDSTRDKFEESFISLSIASEDDQKMRSLFDKLSEGGTVTAPLKTESWGSTFGTVTDKYGVDWMISIN